MKRFGQIMAKNGSRPKNTGMVGFHDAHAATCC